MVYEAHRKRDKYRELKREASALGGADTEMHRCEQRNKGERESYIRTSGTSKPSQPLSGLWFTGCYCTRAERLWGG